MRTTRPSTERLPNVRRANTATSPTAVIVAASPRLNATISARPSPIRWSAIAESRTTSADGHGRRPAATPTPRIPLESARRRGDGRGPDDRGRGDRDRVTVVPARAEPLPQHRAPTRRRARPRRA
jgi:hypothetical protein